MRRTYSLNGLNVLAEEPASARHPPVVLVHGMFAGAWSFEFLQGLLAQHGFPSYALDLRGHLSSRPVPDLGRVSVRDFVEDGIELARSLGTPMVIGHSMGGLVAQKMAEAGAVSAAVLLCPAPPGGIVVTRPHHIPYLIGWSIPMLTSAPIHPARRTLEALAMNRTPEELRPLLFERLVPESGRAGREMSLGVIRVRESEVRCPVLCVTASEDRMIVPGVVRRIARKYGATCWEFARHAHFFLSEPGWEEPATLIAHWLASATQERPLDAELVRRWLAEAGGTAAQSTSLLSPGSAM